ncbi:MAG: hypothetical protein ACLU38_16050 [Dysosmobacter sp.]
MIWACPILAFYGDWTKAPIIGFHRLLGDAGRHREQGTGLHEHRLHHLCRGHGSTPTWATTTTPACRYFADRNAISPDNSNDMMDSLTGIYTGLLRAIPRR